MKKIFEFGCIMEELHKRDDIVIRVSPIEKESGEEGWLEAFCSAVYLELTQTKLYEETCKAASHTTLTHDLMIAFAEYANARVTTWSRAGYTMSTRCLVDHFNRLLGDTAREIAQVQAYCNDNAQVADSDLAGSNYRYMEFNY